MNNRKILLRKIGEKFNKALVTGGAGFIGSHICEELISSGIEIVAIDDFSAGKEKNISHLIKNSNFSYVKCDITDLDSLKKVFDGVDLVFHNAASKKNICLLDPRRDLAVNALGTFNLLELSLKHNISKFIHASTGAVYGETKYFPLDEKHPFIPVSNYGVSKLAGERYVQLFNEVHGLDTTILRYFHVYGPRQESNEFGGVVSIFIRNLLEGRQPTIFGDGTQNRSFTYVKDIVDTNFLASLSSQMSGEFYNCASGISVTINEVCDYTIDFFGKTGVIQPRYDDWLPGDIIKVDIDNSKIISAGMKFHTNFQEMHKKTIEEMILYLKNKEN